MKNILDDVACAHTIYSLPSNRRHDMMPTPSRRYRILRTSAPATKEKKEDLVQIRIQWRKFLALVCAAPISIFSNVDWTGRRMLTRILLYFHIGIFQVFPPIPNDSGMNVLNPAPTGCSLFTFSNPIILSGDERKQKEERGLQPGSIHMPMNEWTIHLSYARLRSALRQWHRARVCVRRARVYVSGLSVVQHLVNATIVMSSSIKSEILLRLISRNIRLNCSGSAVPERTQTERAANQANVISYFMLVYGRV